MKFAPVRPAEIEFDEDGTPRSAAYGDVYHARAGALEQARAVFLAGNGLPQRWQGCDRFVILETGFGLGHNFLATWQTWRDDPLRPRRLFFASVDKHPVRLDDLVRVHRSLQESPVHELARQLHRQWPDPSPDLHRLSFEDGRVILLLAHADVNTALREWRLQADACFLDGFSPQRNEAMWSTPVLRALGRLSAEGTTAATWSAATAVKKGLESAGFEVRGRAGFAGKREMTVATRRADRRPVTVAHPMSPSAPGEPILIIGAGLAGAACAQALAEAGCTCTVLERQAEPALGASGNPAGLVHGVVHAEDGAHARLSRAAAWMAQRHYQPLIEAGVVQGRLQGLFRREDRLDLPSMQALLESLGLPKSHIEAVSRDGANGWHYPGGGWIDPRSWIQHALTRPGVTFMGQTEVVQLKRSGPAGERWQLIDAQGRCAAEGATVVLCQASGILTTLPQSLTSSWPLGRTRGQVTRVMAGDALATRLPELDHPMSGGGYAVTLPGGDLLCGATTSREDEDPNVREADHAYNLQRAQALLGAQGTALEGLNAGDANRLWGRVGWRFHADDRLPLVGPVPAFSNAQEQQGFPSGRPTRRPTRRSDLPLEPGLLLCTGLGSRGLTWAPMIGAALAHWVTGEPAPLPTSLMSAMDPRRFALRRARRG